MLLNTKKNNILCNMRSAVFGFYQKKKRACISFHENRKHRQIFSVANRNRPNAFLRIEKKVFVVFFFEKPARDNVTGKSGKAYEKNSYFDYTQKRRNMQEKKTRYFPGPNSFGRVDR